MPKKPAEAVSKVKLVVSTLPASSYSVSAPTTAFAAAFDETVKLVIMIAIRSSWMSSS